MGDEPPGWRRSLLRQARSRASSLLATLAEATESPIPQRGTLIDQFTRAVEEWHRDAALDIQGLAARLGCSVRSIERVCQQEGRPSPLQCLRQRRLTAMAQLLRETRWPIKQVARTAGFADPDHGARCFQRVYGKRPSDYRSQGQHQSSGKSNG